MIDETEHQKECEIEYEECLTHVERHQGYHLIWVWGLIIAIAVICQWVAPIVFPGDKLVLSRALILNVVPDLIGVAILMSAIVLLDLITPGQTLQRATSEPIPAAIVIGAFVISVAVIMMNSF